MSPLELFYYAIGMQRPYRGDNCGRLLAKLARLAPANAEVFFDGIGNLHVDNRKHGERTLMVAHVDTVHWKDAPNKFVLEGDAVKACGQPLGADDAAGIAVVYACLLADKPIYAIFTVGEEQGGVGSSWLAKEKPELLAQFDRAIAFDRRGTYSVISHQAGERCCSDVFAEALSDALNQDSRLLYMPDDGGVYTDTKEFVDIIPECTNVSAGYYAEHGTDERQDLRHHANLIEQVVKIDWERLPTKRTLGYEDDSTVPPYVLSAAVKAVEGKPQEFRCVLATHGADEAKLRLSLMRNAATDYLESVEEGFHWEGTLKWIAERVQRGRYIRRKVKDEVPS